MSGSYNFSTEPQPIQSLSDPGPSNLHSELRTIFCSYFWNVFLSGRMQALDTRSHTGWALPLCVHPVGFSSTLLNSWYFDFTKLMIIFFKRRLKDFYWNNSISCAGVIFLQEDFIYHFLLNVASFRYISTYNQDVAWIFIEMQIKM